MPLDTSVYWNEPLPPPEVIALNRMAYGPTPTELEKVRKQGFKAYVEEQLYPDDAKDVGLQHKLTAARLHIEYSWKGKKTAENRPLGYLQSSIENVWKLVATPGAVAYEEKIRPAQEVQAATWLRAVYSQWQLREILAEFWHNHFSVSISKDERIAATFPVYDRNVIRKNCLGNFRVFLEAVAQSATMQYYLNNVSSKASPANENYARELFELHTLGASHYYNHLYNRWREVPGATEGKPIGYIDEDIYEAARAFTGWTIADGTDNGKGGRFPNTGNFLYYEGWHDNYQKRILGVEFSPNQPPLADGQKVLDLVASHPATAQHLCTKLCKRLISDYPPDSVVQQAVKVWMDNRHQPDQIRRVVRSILLSDAFAQTWGQKVKRPFELVASFLRASQADFTPDAAFLWLFSQSGYRMFDWPTPTGHPDTGNYWLSSQFMLVRWRLIEMLFQDWLKTARLDLKTLPDNLSSRQLAEDYLKQFLSRSATEKTLDILANFLAVGGSTEEAPAGTTEEVRMRLRTAIHLIGMLPEFQIR